MDTKNIMVMGDTHIPFHHPKYLQHCKDVAKYFKITHFLHIGDELDHHAESFHESDPDGYSAGSELELAIECLAEWHSAFPYTEVILGNHSRIIWRKMRTAGLSLRWARTLSDVLNTPTWTYQHRVKHDGVLYIHGEGVTARTKALRTGCSVVQGHRHTEGYVWFYPNEDKTIFGMQVGTGIDAESYAFSYAKDQPQPVLSCGVVLEHGTLPILLPMT